MIIWSMAGNGDIPQSFTINLFAFDTQPEKALFEFMSYNDKPFMHCRRCSQPFHYKMPRNWFGRNLLFFLPIKRYFCAKCLKPRYRILTSAQERNFQV